MNQAALEPIDELFQNEHKIKKKMLFYDTNLE